MSLLLLLVGYVKQLVFSILNILFMYTDSFPLKHNCIRECAKHCIKCVCKLLLNVYTWLCTTHASQGGTVDNASLSKTRRRRGVRLLSYESARPNRVFVYWSNYVASPSPVLNEYQTQEIKGTNSDIFDLQPVNFFFVGSTKKSIINLGLIIRQLSSYYVTFSEGHPPLEPRPLCQPGFLNNIFWRICDSLIRTKCPSHLTG